MHLGRRHQQVRRRQGRGSGRRLRREEGGRRQPAAASRKAWRRNQVLLRVRFAEVSRSAMTELGVTSSANGFDQGRWFGRTTTRAVRRPGVERRRQVRLQRLPQPVPLRREEPDLAGVIHALQNKGLFQSLAEPNLIAENGKEASFLAGGEYPYPVVQGGGGRNIVTIQFKEFGVRLNFTPDDRRRRPGQAQGAARGQLARLLRTP